MCSYPTEDVRASGRANAPGLGAQLVWDDSSTQRINTLLLSLQHARGVYDRRAGPRARATTHRLPAAKAAAECRGSSGDAANTELAAGPLATRRADHAAGGPRMLNVRGASASKVRTSTK
jgi:hypothetical protein